jgi:predicted NBD/HSP70 family sugar kinase
MEHVRKGERRKDPNGPRPLADAVLRLIWRERRISRAAIARRATLSRSTVSEVVSEILPTGLVAESGLGKSRGGRRPVLLEFQDDACVILGIEMGASHAAAALTDLRGNVLVWEVREHPVRTDPVGTRALIGELAAACLKDGARERRPLVGIGVAIPSPFDPAHPDQLSTIVLPAWEGRLGLEGLSERFGVPLMVDNDANLGALAEHWWGAGRGVGDFAYIKLATGIGSGHIIRGEIYRGATGVAGEIGHTAIDPSGKPCICGLRGCLVTMIGTPALLERAGDSFNIHDLEDAALNGDQVALQVAQEAAGHLGTVVAGLLNLLNPSMVVVGGDLVGLGELLLVPLRETALSRTLVSSVKAAEIRASELGPRSVAIGAATLVLKAALEDSRLFPAVGNHSAATARRQRR